MGLYVIALSLRRGRYAQVGALGMLKFEPGLYLYAGSALRGMENRLARHKRREKLLKWHIDYLRRITAWEWAAAFPAAIGECRLAELAAGAAQGSLYYPRFGASDCRCPGHLIFSGSAPEKARSALLAMGGRSLEAGGGKAARLGGWPQNNKGAPVRC